LFPKTKTKNLEQKDQNNLSSNFSPQIPNERKAVTGDKYLNGVIKATKIITNEEQKQSENQSNYNVFDTCQSIIDENEDVRK
jgi:hypothetical protein